MMRQITFTIYEIGLQSMEQAADGRYDLVQTPVCTIEDSSMTKAKMRAAIKEAGVDCPRGTDVYATKKGRVRYKFETADLMSIVKEREELPVEGIYIPTNE